MVPFDLQLIRLVVHVLAATIWVGGQFVLAGLLPTLRGLGDDATAKVARAFNRLAWPAYVVLLGTGIWNLFEVNFSDRTTQYQVPPSPSASGSTAEPPARDEGEFASAVVQDRYPNLSLL